MNEKENKSTESVHGGETKFKHMGSLTNPIFQTSTYAFESTSQLRDFMEGRLDREEEYGRYGNPTMDAAQRKLAELDHAQRALLFSSGMNAVCTTLFALLEQGMHIIIT
ncbi:MAG: PLP-dependent transferase, partial [Spirochaetota bacterium]|nr:PLP-dependent transferase [Spirochaetota bacterium]